jgi:hypothetical protein
VLADLFKVHGCFDWRTRSAIFRQILRRPMASSGIKIGLVASDLRSCKLPTNSGYSMSPVRSNASLDGD